MRRIHRPAMYHGELSDRDFGNVVFGAHLNNTSGIVDVKGHTLTAAGSAAISAAQGPFGDGSLLFGGGSDKVSAPNSPNWNIGAADFNLRLWVQPNSVTGFQELFTTSADVGTSQGMFVLLNGTEIRFNYTADGVTFGSNALDTSGAGMAIGKRTWIEVVRQRGDVIIFNNGVGLISAARAGTIFYSGSQKLSLGQANNSPSPYSGYMGDVRFTVGVPRNTRNHPIPTRPFQDY